ncbi:MAG TPA: PAS domain S-box protein [Mycobacteriales bacterium]|nr:PAS domain S-box protein [Mycobacteriales bacterium]
MPNGATQRQLTLPPSPESARAARRFVAEVLGDAVEGDLVDVATLLTSELVTNGIVHAHTELGVVVEVLPHSVRVEVADGNPALPGRRDYDESAMTGRGLEMVELLSHDFGVEPIGDGGKRVWFRLVRGDTSGVAAVEPDAEQVAEVAPRRVEAAPAAGCRTIELRGLPVALYCAWQQHADAMLREAALIALDGHRPGGGPDDYPLAAQALGALAGAADRVFGLRDEGVGTADVSLQVAADALPWFPVLRDVLARASALAGAGRLLTPPSLPEIVALRNWVCDETARQTAGLRPQAWEALSLDEAAPAAVAPETLAAIRESALALVAADSSNRIVAVSGPAAELLGWETGALEGRRLVTIIPTRLRDRHIAGFTRHLLDGSSTILGRPVDVPALRRDGTEVEVALLIERRPDPTTRALFVATLTAHSA